MSMNRQTIKEAKAEAQTFIKACDDALARLDAENDDRAQWYAERHAAGIDEPTPGIGQHPDDHSYGSKETGTLAAEVDGPHPHTGNTAAVRGMKYLWKCNPLAVILTAISTIGIFVIFAQLERWDIGLGVSMAPFIFGYCWFRLGQYALLRSLHEASKATK